MSEIYTTFTDKVVDLLDDQRATALSEDLGTTVTAVKKGQYTPGGSADKPIVYVRLQRSGVVRLMAGRLKRQERMMFVISGAASAATQEAAQDAAMALANNVERILSDSDNVAIAGYWHSSMFGWTFSDEETSPAPFIEFEVDPTPNMTVVHFRMFWSCDAIISQEPL